mgnify:FL=1
MPEQTNSVISSAKLDTSYSLSANQWVRARYELKTDDFEKAAIAIVRGQTIGNPSIRAGYESEELVKKHLARYKKTDSGACEVYFPKRNFGHEGVNYLLSVLMGGQCDIDLIQECRLVDLDISALDSFRKPRYGVKGIRDLIKVYDRPLIGGIIKPKIGMTPQQVADVCYQMADGGIDFIKEDEILADQAWCPMSERIPMVAKALSKYRVIYAPCITADGKEVLRKARKAVDLGATAVHLNIWCSLGAYQELRRRVNIPIFFQKSGDKVWTTGPYSIDFKVICKLVNAIGCDFAHVGMWGGYMAEQVGELKERILALGNTLPSFSCGVRPEHVPKLRTLFGNDIMISSGGYIGGHPAGVTEAVKEFRRQL